MLEIGVAEGRLTTAALALLYNRLPRDERARQFAQVHRAVDRGELSLDDLLIARVDGDLAGVVFAVRRPGRAAFLWPPVVADRYDLNDVSRQLLQVVACRLDAAGVLFIQSLIEPDDTFGRQVLACGGFPHCTDLLLMTRAAVRPAEPSHRSADDQNRDERRRTERPGDDCRSDVRRLASTAFTEVSQEVFARVVEASFAGSLDCPELARLRRGDEALALHRTAGPFDPEQWRLYRNGETTVGVLLSVDHDDRDSREIVYLGVVPRERGYGLGRMMVDDAAERAACAGRETLEVAVDAGNRYALALYRDAGFIEQRRMAVHLRLQNANAARIE
ncbi:MAG: GNAT family N-acetyltransferase [Planctomycetaceae bacterium]|nr:GNAT family N-acetyltransferase [Planctomycetaceae bacterium]